MFKEKVFCFILLVLFSVFAYSQEFNSETDFKWERSGNGVIITDYIGTRTEIRIPSQIQEMPVIGIGEKAFSNRRLTSVIIPDSVTSIGEDAFYNNHLTTLIIGNSVERISRYAFRGNVDSTGAPTGSGNRLTSIIIPNSVTFIGDSAFSNNQLTSVTFGNRVATIGDHAFRNNQLTSITIPNSVTNIGYAAFAQNQIARTPSTGRATVHSTAFSNQRSQQDSLSKLTGNLAGGLGLLGSFSRGERVNIPQMFLRAIDLTTVGNELHYLVAINDRQWANQIMPFYIISTRRFNMMNFDFANTITESLLIEYVEFGEYLQNRVPRQTYVFKIVN
jgi:hypothetical protein